MGKKRIGKRIEKAQKTESIRYNTKTRNARESAAYTKPLDNRSNISHNSTEQEQKTKDKPNDNMAICRQATTNDMRGMGRKNQGGRSGKIRIANHNMRGHVALDKNQPQRKFYKSNQQINQNQRTKTMKKTIICIYLIAAVLVGIAAGLSYNQPNAYAQGAADLSQCINDGASGWYIINGRLRCIFD